MINQQPARITVRLRLDFNRFSSFEDDLRVEREVVLIVSTPDTSLVLLGALEKAEHREIREVILNALQRREGVEFFVVDRGLAVVDGFDD